MAQDYLAIQGSATPSEHAFSSGGLTGTKYHNHLNRMVFENFQLLKSAYHNGHISAASDARQHIDALIAALDDEEVDDKDLPEPNCIPNSCTDSINMERFIFDLVICRV